MPTIHSVDLERFVASILTHVTVPLDEAATVARLSVAANLADHDSHGVTLIPSYVAQIRSGAIRPAATLKIVRESPTTTVIDGDRGFGYVTTDRAMDITMQKAADCGLAVATVRRQSHIGRLAAYPIKAADAGFISIIMASGSDARYVVPFGGARARLGTNPISIAVPSTLDGAFAFDMATSGVAGGRVRMASLSGESIPSGWIVDGSGQPSIDPDDLGRGGALLPLGGELGHKGYALSAMVEVFARLLPALDNGAVPGSEWGNGCFLACFAVSAFGDPAEFERDVAESARYLTSTPAADGFDEVVYPGELAHRRETERRRDGIVISASTWSELTNVAAACGVAGEFVPNVGGNEAR